MRHIAAAPSSRSPRVKAPVEDRSKSNPSTAMAMRWAVNRMRRYCAGCCRSYSWISPSRRSIDSLRKSGVNEMAPLRAVTVMLLAGLV